MPRLARLAVALLALPACDGGLMFGEDGMNPGCVAVELDDTALDGLEAFGCGWHVRAVNSRGHVLLTFDVPEFAEALDGAAASNTYALPHDAVRLTVEAGCGLDEGLCGELADRASTVATTYTPTAGEAQVELAVDGTATVTLTGVTFEDEGGNVVSLSAATYTVALAPDRE